MAEQEEQMDKARLLNLMNTSYAAFTQLLSPLSEAQLTTPGVTGLWSIKDILAHLAVWEHHALNYLLAAEKGDVPPESTLEELGYGDAQPPEADALPPEERADEFSPENSFLYHQNKERPLADVQDDFRLTFADIVATVQRIDGTLLFDSHSMAWTEGRPLWLWIAGNTYEHYEEHTGPIEQWLAP